MLADSESRGGFSILILVYENERVSFFMGVWVWLLLIALTSFYLQLAYYFTFLGLDFLSAILGFISGILFLLSNYKNNKLYIFIMIVSATLIRIFYFNKLTFLSFGISQAFAVATFDIAFLIFGFVFVAFSGTVGFILSKFRKK